MEQLRGLIGQGHAVHAVEAWTRRALDGRGSVIVIAGEAGSGKTALLHQALSWAEEQGAVIGLGTCWDHDQVPGLHPWSQVLREVRRAIPEAEWAEKTARREEAHQGLPSTEPGDGSPSFRVVEETLELLKDLAAEHPLVLAIDGLQWADGATLRMLDYTAMTIQREPILILATSRIPSETTPEVRQALTRLTSHTPVVHLSPLTVKGTADFIADSGVEISVETAREMHERTGGNPFLIQQTLHLYRATGTLQVVPPGTEGVLNMRLLSVPPVVRATLETAAVLGSTFSHKAIATIEGVPEQSIERRLERAAAAGLVTREGTDTWLFTHGLLQQYIYENLSIEDSQKRHAGVVKALESHPGIGLAMPLGELATHAYHGAQHLEPHDALAILRRAGMEAARKLDTEEATLHLRRAQEVASRFSTADQVSVTLELGQELFDAGQPAEADRMLRASYEAARSSDDVMLLARTALVLHRATGSGGSVPLAGSALHAAYEALGGGTPLEEFDALALEVVTRLTELAHEANDPETEQFCLWAHHDILWGPGTASKREELTRRMVGVSRAAGDYELELYARSLQWVAQLEQANPDYVDTFRESVTAMDRDPHPRSRFSSAIDQCIVAIMRGNFPKAERLLHQASQLTGGDAQSYHSYLVNHLTWSLALFEGDTERLQRFHDELPPEQYPFPRLLEALTLVHRGDLDNAASMADAWSVEALPRPFHALWFRLVAQLAVISGNSERVEKARRLLEPYAGEWIVAVFGCDVSGPADLWLAMLDAASGDNEQAFRRFESAEASARRLGAEPWVQMIKYNRAQAELRDESMRTGAAETLREVADDCERMGMVSLAERARQGAAQSAPQATRQRPEFYQDGSVWRFNFQGKTAHLPHAKGLRDLRHLLLHPHQDVACTDLLDPEAGPDLHAARQFSGVEVLDEQARNAYRSRLEAIERETEFAVDSADQKKLQQLDDERDAIIAELKAATGLGGRARRFGDDTERARKAVTARIRDSLRKLSTVHPPLADYLRQTITTGHSCSYQPPADSPEWVTARPTSGDSAVGPAPTATH